MKRHPWLILLFACWAAPAAAQVCVPVERDRDRVAWERYSFTTNRLGRVLVHTNRHVELETGRHYLRDGQWLESREEIHIVDNGAVATNGPHQVAFALNINSPVSVEVLTPDATRLRIRPLALAYHDFHAERRVLIAQLQDADGLVVGANQVLYPDAFTGLRADVRYTYRKSGLEQDIILRQRPPLPEACGLNPVTTWLLVLTEFIDPPADVQVLRQVRRGWQRSTVDKIIRLGAMSIGHGTAFSLGLGRDRKAGVPVQKHWEVLDGRTFLIEEVSFPRIVPQLRNLQAGLQPAPGSGAGSARYLASTSLSLPPAPVAAPPRARKAMQIAGALPPQEGLVLDFDLESGTGVVLEGNTTYRVTGTVNLTNAVIEGGTVVKYDRGATINLAGPVQCLTGPYNPAVFTAVDDNSVGQSLGTGSPTGRYADCALSLELGGDLKYVHIRHAREAIHCGNNPYSVSHAQLLFCDVGFHSETAAFTNGNILTCQVLTNFYGTHFHGRVEHLTADQADRLMDDWDFSYEDWCSGNPSTTLCLVNTLTASLTNGYAPYPIWAVIANGGGVRDFPTGSGVFQTVGAGAYYLADGSDNRNAGTTEIQPALAAALGRLTTYPPLLYSNVTLATDTTFGPQAQRDTDTPDLGYHYDPLDYDLELLTVTNATLTVTPGTAIGCYAPGDDPALGALMLARNARLFADGSPHNLTRFCWYNLVQEQTPPPRAAPDIFGAILAYFLTWDALQSHALTCRFTDFSRAGGELITYGADGLSGPLSLSDCQFHHGSVTLAAPDIPVSTLEGTLTNCLFERVALNFYGGALPFSVTARNNLFWNGSLLFDQLGSDESPAGSTLFTFLDNAFYQTAITQNIQTTNVTLSAACNAYLTNCARLTPTNASDIVTNLTWEPGPLGNYYLGSDSPLINAGSTNADLLGLYHYTTQTSQAKETNSVVDIGLHYVALDTSGIPLDTDGDGVPDYLEDANGNGTADLGEQDWQVSENGTTGVPGLRVFTPLK